MSRSSRRNQRLHLYDLGNDRCPICLTNFERTAVEAGRDVTLEHVPPRGLATGSIAMCLTCKPCNNKAGEGVDHAAISLARWTTRSARVRVDFPSAPPMTGYWTPGNNGGLVVYGRPGVEPQITADTKFQMSYKLPQVKLAVVSHLKSAYLSVFSLLGSHGYRYAESRALLPVRQQIMNPGEKVIQEHFACKVDNCTVDGNAIIMNREQQHWAVKVGDCIVLLPRGGDDLFYEEAEVVRSGGHGTINGPLWYPLKFGQDYRGSMTFKTGVDIRALSGVDNLFGKDGKTVDGNGIERPFVVADHQGLNATLVAMPGA